MKKTIAILLAIFMLFTLFQGALRENAVTADSQPIWPMFRYNNQHTGRCPYDTSKNDGVLKWNYRPANGWQLQSSPTIGSDGTIYAAGYAINPDGIVKWQYNIGLVGESSPAIGSDGTIYEGSWDNYLYAINPDGTLKWKYKTGGAIHSSPAIGPDGTIYVGSYDSYLYALNPDGSVKWQHKMPSGISSSPAISSDGTVYVGSTSWYLHALNPDSSLKWEYKTGGIVFSSPAIGSDGKIYVGSNDHYLYSFNPDGTLNWRYKTGNEVRSSPAIGSDGTIYIGPSDSYLYAITPTGALKWKFNTEQGASSSPVISGDGTIFVCANGLYALNPSGKLRWQYKSKMYFSSSPAIASDGTIYIGADYLYAINGTKPKVITIVLKINSPNIILNGESKPIDAQGSKPIIENGRTLVPIRSIVEALGGTIEWDSTTQKVGITLKDKTIGLVIGQHVATVNGLETQIDSQNPKVVPEIINGRTMLPLRFVTENLGCDVQWDGMTKTITITYPKP